MMCHTMLHFIQGDHDILISDVLVDEISIPKESKLFLLLAMGFIDVHIHHGFSSIWNDMS